MDDMFETLNYQVQEQDTTVECRTCGHMVKIANLEKRMARCGQCGSAVMLEKPAVHVRPECDMCDDTGLVWVPVSGRHFYIACARCHCAKGGEVSDKISLLPEVLSQLPGGRGSSSFMGRRKLIHDAIERQQQKAR